MHGWGAHRGDRKLREIVAEASRALALLDAERIEELARACHALNREPRPIAALDRANAARQAREAAGEMAVFARVLDATRANLAVVNRLRGLRQGSLGYAEASPERAQWGFSETCHGDD